MSQLHRLLVPMFVLALAAGCTQGEQRPSDGGSASPTPTTTAPEPEPTTGAADQEVPNVLRLQFSRARRALLALDLRVRRAGVSGTACRPRGLVLDQKPPPGRTVSSGTRITVMVNQGGFGQCGLDLAPAPEHLDRAARAFLRFARHGGVPPIDTPVDLYLGGRLIETIDASRAINPRAWRICPAEGLYAARVCPLSALDVLQDHIGPVAITSQPPQHPCLHQGSAPGAHTTDAVTLTPDENLDCVNYVAVQLLINDVGQVTGVNLVLSEP